MAESPMEWESADREHLGGFKDFAISSVYIIAAILGLLVWMFVYLVMGSGFFFSLLLAVPIIVLTIVIASIVKGLIW